MRGSNFGQKWLDHEKNMLLANYGKIPKNELMDLLPNRTWRTIMERARILGVNGDCNFGRNKYICNGDTATIFLEQRNGTILECYISAQDSERVINIGKWRADYKKKSNTYYARCNVSSVTGKTYIYMHRAITDCPKELMVDHKDGNTLNNTRDNLRIVTKSENGHNIIQPARAKSGIRNLYWNKSLGLWVVRVSFNKKTKCRYFKTREAAEKEIASVMESFLIS